MSFKDKLTIVTFTNFWKEAPSTWLIEKTFDSLYKNIEGLKECRHIINFDMKNVDSEQGQYLFNLVKLKEKYNKNIEVMYKNTITKQRSKVYADIVNMIDTPYILFWEHDFILQKSIPLDSIIKVMDSDNGINYIRFNKRENQKASKINSIDGWFEQDPIKPIPLIKFCGYSGNPHIERTSWFNSFCRPLINNIPVKKKNSIERAMNLYILKEKRKRRPDDIHKEVGSYVYGNIGDSAYVKSLDIYKSKEAWGSKNPSEKWKKHNEI